MSATAVAERRATGQALDVDQVDAVERITMGGEAVIALVGPAGAGKSATVGVAADAYTRSDVPVRGLAVSAKAAAVLREEAGITNSDTVAKLLYEHNQPDGPQEPYRIQQGEVLIVDEASMVSSADFARLVTLAETHEAKIVAVGDYRQLGAVEAGGLYRLIARTDDAVELNQVWRFHNQWERNASLQLRAGNNNAINAYDQNNRIHGGSREEQLDRAFHQWASARADGESVLVTATDRQTVAEFNAQARHHLQLLGHIAPNGVMAGDIEAAVGDEILTLRNDRRLITSGGSHVRNGDRWQITGHNTDGGLHLDGLDRQGQITIPHAYADNDGIGYAYATTVHKAQGTTVDHAITIVDERTTAESLYVGATRGRADNQLLAVTEPQHSEYELETAPTPTANDIIATALARETAERAATEILRQQLDQPHLADRLSQQHADPPTGTEERTAESQELTGAQLRALWAERTAIDMDIKQAEAKVFSNDLVARRYASERVEQLDQQIARLQQDADYRQHRLGGHDHDTHHLQQLQQDAATRGTEIDRLLTGDVTARTHRLTTPGHVQELEEIAGPFPGADHINEWVTLAVHLDQHHHTWPHGTPADAQERAVFEHHTRQLAGHQHAYERAIEPPELGHHLGISL